MKGYNMKIMHIQLAGPYTEGASYQENILPKFHVKMGHEVYFLASCYSWNKGDIVELSPVKKTLSDGVVLERVKFIKIVSPYITEKMRLAKCVYQKIDEYNPDFIMLHDVQSLSNKYIVRYLKKHPKVRMIVDCHTDYSNSATNWLSKNILHGILWRHQAKMLVRYTEKFYGVLPARVDFLKDVYRIPKEKCDLLVMGADDDLVDDNCYFEKRNLLRKAQGIESDDFVIVFGGKLDSFKKQVLLLMDAVNELSNGKLKLYIFGSVIPELLDETMKRCSPNVKYLGWADLVQSYEYFQMSDVACFPGRHSVYWEQAAGMGIPLIVKRWPGTTHVDLGGNAIFLNEDSKEEIKRSIEMMMNDYSSYKNIAEKGKKVFRYSVIAKKCIENLV